MRIVSDDVAENGLFGDDRPSLFLAGAMSRCAGSGADLVNSSHGYIDEVGFSGNWADRLLQRPPRNTGYSQDFCSDRFLYVQSGDSGRNLALIDIREQFVYDARMHADIDCTGFEVIVTFHPEAFGIVEDILQVLKTNETV